ncbi:MAG TPA: NAD-glutamate dehydrogenase domain-containing protein [Mariprofundaceae bacterium]|nr:NAD-glutamate dehydrogenase domain-containing protein [Mariprofundaceae bacterium]
MRHLRQQLIQLLDQSRREQKIGRMSTRLTAALVQDFQKLLPFKMPQTKVEMGDRMLSHGDLHRHIITIRCPDQAFYLDAIKGYLLRKGVQPLMQQTMVMAIECDEFGCSLELRQPGADPDKNFMFISLHISATLVPDLRHMVADIRAILHSVELSVADFGPMNETVRDCVGALAGRLPEAAELLAWLNDNRYIYFGMQQNGDRLGLLRNKRTCAHIAPGLLEAIDALPPPEQPGVEWLLLDVMHRFLYATGYVEIFRIAWPERADGRLHTVYVLGHFSRSARYTNAGTLPVLGHAWQELAESRELRHSAFYRREVRTIFDRMSKPALLATRPLDWLAPMKAVIDMSGPTETVCQFVRPRLGNTVMLFVAMAADRFGPNTLKALLTDLTAHGLVIHGHENFGVGPHRLLLIYADRQLADGKDVASLDETVLQETVHRNVIFWKDLAKAVLFRHSRKIDMPAALAELEALPKLYADLFPPEQFLADLSIRPQVTEGGRIHVRASNHGEAVELHILSPRPLMLGELVDLIRAFGLIAEREAVVGFGISGPAMQINCLHCQSPAGLTDDRLQQLRRGVEHVFNAEADHDALNRLLIMAGLTIEQIAIAITLRNHLVQLMPDAAPSPLTDMLLRHPQVTAALLELFAARHHPARQSNPAVALQAFERALESVETLTDDRWFRALGELVQAGLRTNAYTRRIDEPVAIKIAPEHLSFNGGPHLWREIFVHGVHLEGVHLRAGPVARGGIRYSDRPADFRTEIMELMATQTIKNGLIVPIGAKGGFVIRGGDGPEFVLRQYRTFIRALLGLTDNLLHGVAVPPAGIHVPEEDAADPYLVVAADKGTARFSDDANEESRLAGFWLDDAFASGGRHGYDHKAVGITARGAWTCVAHHFARLGQDAWTAPLSCIGIGDMSGDVFGNGMLLNPNLQLVGAFNHRHIFLDPAPDRRKAFAERQRLFTEAKGWGDYDPRRISKGGGVFERSAKSIPLADEARQVLGVEAKRLSGEALIQAMLKAPVDLLYNGGIGTYVKASAETHAEVRDPANNSVRVDAAELRCRVVGEGGNLGFTQQARLEYAAADGRINTDATDNSGGVDMSDHEVNLKILFSATPAGRIGIAERNRLLKRLTGEVTEQCLTDNLLQSRALTLAELNAAEHPHRLSRLVRELAEDGWLSADNAPGMERQELHRLRPMLSVLLGQEKNRLHARLSESNFRHSSLFADDFLRGYFPTTIHRRFTDELGRHPLAAEIVATRAVNHIVNDLGLTAVLLLQTLLEQPVEELVEGLLIAESLLDIPLLREAIWQRIADVEAAAGLQHALQLQVQRFTEELLQLQPVGNLDAGWLTQQHKAFRHFRHSLAAQGIAGSENSRFLDLLKNYAQAGLATDEAAHLASMPDLSQFAAALHLATARQLPLSRCLKASQACLHLLPFAEMEAPLRSTDWGEEEAHPLRREWLHRLAHLKTMAIGQLLESRAEPLAEGEKRWSRHAHWQELQAYRQAQGQEAETTPENRRMHLLLALSRLETLIEES